MVYPSRQFTKRSAKRGETEREQHKKLVQEAGGWFLYMRGQRLKREQAEAEGQGKRPRGKGVKHG